MFRNVHLKSITIYLYASDKSFADTIVCSWQTSYMKSLQLQSWEVVTYLHGFLLKNKED